MRTTIDIPDETYRQIKLFAASEGTTLKEIILESVLTRLQSVQKPTKQASRFRVPVIRSSRPGSLKLGEEGVYEYIPFP